MSLRHLVVLALGLMLIAPEALFAQPGYMRGKSYRKRKDNGYSRRKPKRRERKERRYEEEVEEIDAAGTDKKTIEIYLQKRLLKLKKSYDKQSAFGRGMGAAWKKFWDRLYEERKKFEVGMARQRLDHFNLLGSLPSGGRAQSIADFERTQTNLIKNFEADQKSKMVDYFKRQIADLDDFHAEQEATRLGFMNAALKSLQGLDLADEEEERKEEE